MAKIHGIVYLAVGLFISAVSWKVNKNKLLFFYYVGFLFALAGVIKIVYSFGKGKNVEKTSAPSGRNLNLQHRVQQWKRCKKCNNVMKFNDIFCSRCGAGS